ncbi:MAG: VWA domain-containing protein, partial [Phycisphaerales bacterium]|nr:VWA domain-containing protein [Phycisphaerales bacterium]
GDGRSDSSGSGTGAGADSNASGSGGVLSANPDERPAGTGTSQENQPVTPTVTSDRASPRATLPRIGFTPSQPVPPSITPTGPLALGDQGAGSSVSGSGGVGGSGGSGGTGFMGIETDAKRIVYLLDFSNSMFGGNGNPKIDHMLFELKKSVNRLPSDHSFYVIFFDNEELPMPPDAMVLASKSNKSTYFAWADTESVGPSSRGGTDPSGALDIALSRLKPDAIFLLTDGGFDADRSFQVINTKNADHRVEINTIGFHDRSNEAVMQQIATENHGEYRYIPPPQP